MITDMQRELKLFRNTLDWVKTKTFDNKDQLVEYYEQYFATASTHVPLINEPWNPNGVHRHGATDVKGTVSEMLTEYYCIIEHRWKSLPIGDRIKQVYGCDVTLTQGIKRTVISVKSTKPKSMFVNGDLDIRLTLYKDYFKPAVWRADFISCVEPITKQIWMFNYPALAKTFCDVNAKGLCKPKFDSYAHVFIKQFESQYTNCLIYHDLRK